VVEEHRFTGVALALLVALVMSLAFVGAVMVVRDAATEKGRTR
jgi:Na+-translocating ferredoxin:NAD+ oxidoreductase RnfA subunit